MNSLKNGIVWNTINQVGLLGIQFVSTIVLARFLTPSDYGLLGIVTIFISLSNMLVDSGMAGYIVKNQQSNYIDYSTLFFYNIFVSISLYGLLFFGATYISDFYNKPILIKVIRISTMSILICGLSDVQNAILTKKFEFKFMAITNIVSGIISFVVASVFAYVGLGIWALVTQQLLSLSLSAFICFCHLRFLPSLIFSKESFKKLYSFGFYLLGSNVINVLSSNLTNNFIAKIAPLHVVGNYVQAYRFQNYPVSILTNIIDKTIFPIFSRIDDSSMLTRFKVLRRNCYSVMFPVFVLLILNAKFIFYILLGEKWMGAVWMFQLLLIATFPALAKALNRNILKSRGITNDIMKCEMITLCVFLPILLLSWIFSNIVIVILAFVVSQFFSCIYMFVSVRRYTKLKVFVQCKDFMVYLIFSFIPLFVIALLKCHMSFDLFDNVYYILLLLPLSILLSKLSNYVEYLHLYNNVKLLIYNKLR